MRITLPRAELAAACREVLERTTPAKHQQLPYTGVHAVTIGDAETRRLRLSGWDGDTLGAVDLPAPGADPLELLLPGRMFLDIVKLLPSNEESVAIEGDESNEHRITITCGRANFEISTLDVKTYPAARPSVPKHTEGAVAGRLDSTLLAAAIRQVASSADHSSTTDNVVRIEVAGTELVLAATNRDKLAVRNLTWQPADPDATAHAHVAVRALQAQAAAMTDGFVYLGLNATGLGMASAGRAVVTRLVDTPFVDYRKVLPAESDLAVQLTLPADELVESVRRVSLATGSRPGLLLKLSENRMVVDAGTAPRPGDPKAAEVYDVDYQGPEHVFSVNEKDLLAGITACGSSAVRLASTGAGKPTLLTSSADARSFLYVLTHRRQNS